ncbi:MAG: hypothetical protein R3B94_12165 [Hyphomonas sp.]
MTEKSPPKDEKAERLAAALRANLRRRKAAARKPPAPAGAKPAPGK